ncbi:MAG: HD domain-containing protein [Barnesiella sp.]|nr:HD domain-containing protein [Barnesiella sp.]
MDKTELKKTKDRVIELIRSTGIDDIDYFLQELEHSGFFTAPASMKNHLCFEGGLMCHSLNVCETALDLKKMLMASRPDIFEKVSDESIIIASLLHDMCKSDIYNRRRAAQTGFGQAEFTTSPGQLPIGHGEKSVVMLLQMGLPLTDAEICAIRWHMGAWSVNQANNEEREHFRAAEKRYPLVTLIQLADTIASKFTERPPATIND